jgi:uncharacterized protein (TIGR02058 family)
MSDKGNSMSKKRIIVEMGAGNDLHGGDYTKAAIRACDDALHHSSMTFVRTLDVDTSTLIVEVMVGVQKPEEVDLAAVEARFPIGQVKVSAEKGGLDIYDDSGDDVAVIASAAVVVSIQA